jgi:hypothetical protein
VWATLKDYQVDPSDIEVRSVAMVRCQLQPDDVAIEVRRCDHVFGPQADYSDPRIRALSFSHRGSLDYHGPVPWIVKTET